MVTARDINDIQALKPDEQVLVLSLVKSFARSPTKMLLSLADTRSANISFGRISCIRFGVRIWIKANCYHLQFSFVLYPMIKNNKIRAIQKLYAFFADRPLNLIDIMRNMRNIT